jgi:glycosyltransferase involved in cell wall biosynthesis
MSKSFPTVSVLIPCYNHGQHIDDAIDSVFNQTFTDFEILIVDDGSTDPFTIQKLSHFKRPKTVVTRTSNRGPAAARNCAIQKARGSFFCALDADDKLHPEFFAESLAEFERNPAISFVSCWLQMFGDEAWVWQQKHCDLQTLLTECTVATPALVRAEAVRAIGGYDENPEPGFHEDWDFWLSLVEKGFSGTIIPKVLFYYRRQPGSRSQGYPYDEIDARGQKYMFKKHQESYTKNLYRVFENKDRAISEVLRTNKYLEHHLYSVLEPFLQSRHEEIQRLQAKLVIQNDQHAIVEKKKTLETELDHCQRQISSLQNLVYNLTNEVKALRQSKSWKATAPLRTAYDTLQILRRITRPRNKPL